ncbi:MAG: PAS-domain containing protein [Alphaproteobacteria bacterium]|nr:PAS-domain containing protein [Alphaproteobacteria bacterium]
MSLRRRIVIASLRRIRAIPFARRIVLLTVLFLVAVYAGDAAILSHYYGVLASREHEARDARAALLAEHAGRALAAVDLSLQAIAEQLKTRLPLDKPTIFTQLLLDKYAKALPDVHAIFVLDADGNDVNSTLSYPPPSLNLSDRMYFSEQKKWLGVGLYLDRLQVSRADNRVVFTVSRPVLDNNGNFEGIVASVIDPAYFSDFYGQRGGEQGNVVLLERHDGAILAGTGLSDQDLTESELKSVSQHAKAYSTQAEVHGFPARIVLIGKPTITSPQFLSFCAMDGGLLFVMTLIAWWLATAAAREASAVDREARARRTAEARLLSAFESAPAAFALYDSDDRLVLSNSVYRSFFAPIKDLIVPGKSFQELSEASVKYRAFADAHPDEREFLRWRMDQHRLGVGEPVLQLRDGRWILMRERRTDEGDTVLFYSDITPLKEREEQLGLARQLAEQANQAKTAFLANMSHELRTPLNAIIGFSEMIERKVLGPISENYRQYGEIVRTSGEHLLAIINDILDIAKLNAGKTELRLESVDINRTIVEAIAIMSRKADVAGIAIVTDLVPQAPAVEADPVRIRQVLLNVLANAVKFTPASGRIDVSSAVTPTDLRIVVKDNGVGMAPEDIPRALEPFTQVGRERAMAQEGTGLGLPISKTLVEMHGGRLEISSAPKQGTTVTISLPIRRSGQSVTDKPKLDIAV